MATEELFPPYEVVAGVRLRSGRTNRHAPAPVLREPSDRVGAALHALAPFAIFFPGRAFRYRHLGETDEEYAKERAYAYVSAHRTQFCALVVVAVALLALSLTSLVGRSVEIVQPDADFARFSSAETRAARAALAGAPVVLYRLGINASVPTARKLSRADIIGSGDVNTHLLRKRAEKLLAATGAPCVCAAAFGDAVDCVSLRAESANDSVVHLFNVENRDAALYELIDENEASPELGALAVVRHSQATLYDVPPLTALPNRARYAGTSDVDIVRQTELRLAAMDADGHVRSGRVRVSGEMAYCVAECLDLHAGLTIWHRAHVQQQRGVRLQDDADALPRLIEMFT